MMMVIIDCRCVDPLRLWSRLLEARLRRMAPAARAAAVWFHSLNYTHKLNYTHRVAASEPAAIRCLRSTRRNGQAGFTPARRLADPGHRTHSSTSVPLGVLRGRSIDAPAMPLTRRRKPCRRRPPAAFWTVRRCGAPITILLCASPRYAGYIAAAVHSW